MTTIKSELLIPPYGGTLVVEPVLAEGVVRADADADAADRKGAA
ncbi:MAG TPA: hypothetical protein VFU46_01155 [Gemmatimonadales bacterium]|nr:hypothetical protein [Gemmatimonadales bacterium]